MTEQKSHQLKNRLWQWWNNRIIQRWSNIGLQGKMSAMVSVGLTGLIVIFALIGTFTARQTIQQLFDERIMLARLSAATLDASLGNIAGTLTVLANELHLSSLTEGNSSLDQATIETPYQTQIARLQAVLTENVPFAKGIYLISHQGQVIASSAEGQPLDSDQVTELFQTKAVQTALQGMSQSISIVASPNSDEIPSWVVVAVPVIALPGSHSTVSRPEAGGDHASITACLAVMLDLSSPDIFIHQNTFDLGQTGRLEVVDNTGLVLISSDPERTQLASKQEEIISQLFVAGEPGVETCLGCSEVIPPDELSTEEGSEVIAFAPMSQAPWGIIIRQETQELFMPVYRLGLQNLALWLAAILGALILVRITTSSVILPVQQLTEAAQRISDGNLDIPQGCALVNSQRRDEIGTLADSFAMMCSRLKQSMDEVQTWNRQLDARVQSRTQELAILNAVALSVNQSLDIEEILGRTLEEILRLTSIDVGAIFLQEANQGHLKLMAYRGLSEEAARLAAQVGLLDGSCGGVAEIGEVVIVPDLSHYRGRRARSLQRESLTTLVHVPLVAKGCTLGSMCVGTRQLREFSSDEQSLLTAIGNQIAVAIENAQLYAEVQHKEQMRGELFKKVIAAQEEERKRIARELHDEISQSLTVLLYAAEEGLEMKRPAEVKQRLASMFELTRHTLESIHKLIFDLRPSMLDHLGLVPALRWFAGTRLDSDEVRVSVNAQPENLRLPSEVETALYRVIQEAITNISRHAAARNVSITMRAEENAAVVLVEDDGIGFDPSELSISPDSTRGLGLMSMQERVELLGGQMEIDSSPGRGTQIYISLPLVPASSEDFEQKITSMTIETIEEESMTHVSIS